MQIFDFDITFSVRGDDDLPDEAWEKLVRILTSKESAGGIFERCGINAQIYGHTVGLPDA